MQTLRSGCSKAEPKIFAPAHPSRGSGRPKFNQLEIVTTFTYKPSLVRINARNVATVPPTVTLTNKQANKQYNR